jgi:hypothetical protein
MANPTIGHVISGRSGKRFEVAWNKLSGEVYVDWAGWTYVGKATSSSDAMTKAEAWLYNK